MVDGWVNDWLRVFSSEVTWGGGGSLQIQALEMVIFCISDACHVFLIFGL